MRVFRRRAMLPVAWAGDPLRTDALYYGAVTLAERVASILLLPLLAKTLPQALYGVWSQMTVSAGLCSGILLLGLHTAVVRFLPEEPDVERQRRLIHGMLAVVVVNAVLAVAGAILLAKPLSRLVFGDSSFIAYARLLGVLWATEAIFELVAGVLRAYRRIRQVSRYYLVKNLIRLGGLAAGLFVLRVDLVRSLAIVLLAQFVLIVWIYGRSIVSRLDGLPDSLRHPRWREVMVFALPLLPYGVLTWANSFIDRYFLLYFRDIESVGTYALAYSLAAVGGLFYSVPGFVLYPYMAERWSRGDREGAGRALQQTTELYLLVLPPFLVILTMLIRPLTRLLATEAYVVTWPVALLLGAGIGLMGLYQLYLYSTLLLKQTWINLATLVTAVFINIVLNLLLTPRLGLLGAATATVASNAVLAGITMLLSYQALPYVPSWRLIVEVSLAAAVMALFVWTARGVVPGDDPLILGGVVGASLAVYLLPRLIRWLVPVRSQ